MCPGFQLLASAPRVSSGITRKAALGLPVWFSRSCLGTDARRRHPCPARTPGWAGLHCPEPWDRLPARCSPTEGLPGPAALATALPCAFCQGLRRRPRARVGRGGVLTPAGCFPRRTRPVTCTLSFGDSRFLGVRVGTPSGPRFLSCGGDTACSPCRAQPVACGRAERGRTAGSGCSEATPFPRPLGRCPGRQTSRDCAPQALPRGPAPDPALGKGELEAGLGGQPRHTMPVPAAKRCSPSPHPTVHGFSAFNVHVSPLGG